jgi:oxalate decarboxylase/phosphoglucose isomerase-like protein (cupin superfamily)
MQRNAADTLPHEIPQCHGGIGTALCRVVMDESETPPPSEVGIRFVHETTLPPGASVGEHPHNDDEELYFVTRGRGEMIIDGARQPIGPGDCSLVRRGHTHGLINTGDTPLTFIVVCVEPAAD